jgi:tripartite-type tricarboxylate transporter receptor subunit TctC
MLMLRMFMQAAVVATAALGCSLGPLAAETPAEFFKGKTVRLVNGGAPGSGFDLYSRMLAPWLEKRLGASVVVESRPGAGMMIAMNHTWIAQPDGLTMMLAPGEGAILAKLTDEPGVRFDLTKFPIVARVNTAPRVLIVNPKLPWQTFADLLKAGRPLQIGANGKTDAASDTSAVMCHAMKIACKITIGYPSSKDFAYAAITGEVDGTVLVDDSSARYAEGGQLRPLVVTAREHSTLMPKVPTIFEAAPDRIDTEAAWWLDFREDIRKVGRLLITPPGVPADRLEYLRQAARDVLTDPVALADFEKKNQPGLYGEPQEMAAIITRILGGGLTPERLKEVKHVIVEKYY